VGGFRDELNAKDIAYLNEVIDAEGCPFYDSSSVVTAAA
jgi:hypothetical protein